MQYHFTKKTRATLNYAMRDFRSRADGPDAHLDGVKDRLAPQLTVLF